MNGRIFLQFFTILFLTPWISVFSQDISGAASSSDQILDSLKNEGYILNYDHKNPEIEFTVSQAVKYLQRKYQLQNWKNVYDPFRQAMGQLIFNASNPPFDSTAHLLQKYPFDSLNISWDKFYIWEPVRVRIPVNTIMPPDSVNKFPVTEHPFKSVTTLKDTSIMVVIDTLHEVTSPYPEFPFRHFSYPYQSDSIKVAINALLKYLEDRDSTIIYFTGKGNKPVPFWLNSKSDKYERYWLKNDLNDSVTVWIGNISRDTVGLYLEKEVIFKRPPKQAHYSDGHIKVKEVDRSTLLELQKIYIKPHYWKDRLEANFILNQAALSNWVKGGENSLATSMDITEFANYQNKALNLTSANFARIKLGFLKSGNDHIIKNLDLIETNSKLNHKAFGKFDFSAILLFKTQLLKGFNYPNDTVEVSKFLSPAILTIGIGLDYQPEKHTSINFSPFSYKGTFVADTVHIDQTTYGIPKDRKALHEPGISLMVTNEFRPVKSVTVINRLQLFTNYVHDPQNVDVDWEMIATANLNWFTDVRLNTHLIYDDDTKTPVLDDNRQPIMNPDGTVRKSARSQFKEMIGLSIVFRF